LCDGRVDRAGSQRRNVKILKLLGHVLFPWAERLLWIDAKLRLGATDPLAYVEATTARRGACASFVGLPFHSNAYGPGAATMARPSFAAHGETLLRALRSRPTLTDDVGAPEAQLAAYANAAGDAALSAALVDSALVARDLRTPRCRRFHAALGCAWFDEAHGLSARDQLSSPFALLRLGLRPAAPWAPDAPVALRARGDDAPLAVVVPPGGPRRPSFHWRGTPLPHVARGGRDSNRRYYTHALAVGKCLACVRDKRDALRGDVVAALAAGAPAGGARRRRRRRG